MTGRNTGQITLTVVIPTYNGKHLLEPCLASVVAQDYPMNVVVVDDASTDGTAEWVRRVYPSVQLIRRDTQGGFCEAVWSGYEQVKTDAVCFLNNDVTVEPGWARAGIDALASGERVGSAACRILRVDGTDRLDCAGDTYLFFGAAENRGSGCENPGPFKLVTACMASAFYRTVAIRDVGFIDREFKTFLEDVDLGLRLINSGWTCVYAPGSVCRHRRNETYKPDSDYSVAQISRNAEGVYWSVLPPVVLAAGVLPHAAWILVQGVRRLLQGRLGPYLRGKTTFLSELGWWLARRGAIRAKRAPGDPLAAAVDWNLPGYILDKLGFQPRRAMVR